MLDSRGYWNSVTAHEVAHQWWGHAVGFNSYRDQWMSEGFAEESASIFLQLVYAKEPQKFQKFWNDQRDLLTEKSREGYRAIDVAPLTLGYRANNSKTGVDITRRLIYPKGGYVLHMIRMMMWDNRTGDANFKALMHDFVQTYMNRPASTEDFKAMVEKHMTQGMDLDGNHRMDWFFDPWVYGTTYPDYSFTYSFDKGADGGLVMKFKLTQSNVDDRFIMPVPIYLELGNGRVTRLGNLPIQGNRTVEQSVPLGGLKDPPKRAMINYYNDVLCSQSK
jgi:aminopeptidase N